jgi:hypothetical protein
VSILLITHDAPAWEVDLNRFIEVSLGIVIALVMTLVWPMPKSQIKNQTFSPPDRLDPSHPVYTGAALRTLGEKRS